MLFMAVPTVLLTICMSKSRKSPFHYAMVRTVFIYREIYYILFAKMEFITQFTLSMCINVTCEISQINSVSTLIKMVEDNFTNIMQINYLSPF